MAQGCLKCLKLTMCAANFLCFMCGVTVLGFGVYMMINFKLAALTPTLANFNLANMLLISGIVITCVSFLGFLGALKENRCLLLTFFLLLFFLMLVELTVACLLLVYEGEIAQLVQKDLNTGLEKTRNSTDVSDWDLIQKQLDCCGVNNATDWGDNVPKSCFKDGKHRETGCLAKLRNFFEENFLTTGISVIVLCIVEDTNPSVLDKVLNLTPSPTNLPMWTLFIILHLTSLCFIKNVFKQFVALYNNKFSLDRQTQTDSDPMELVETHPKLKGE